MNAKRLGLIMVMGAAVGLGCTGEGTSSSSSSSSGSGNTSSSSSGNTGSSSSAAGSSSSAAGSSSSAAGSSSSAAGSSSSAAESSSSAGNSSSEAGSSSSDASSSGAGNSSSGTGSSSSGPSACNDYCTGIAAACTMADGNLQYSNTAHCLASCEAAPHGGQSGNTQECRIYHLGNAVGDASHCPHAGPLGAGVCGNACNHYCDLMAAYCPDSFADPAACATACATYASNGGDPTDSTTNTVECRIWHAQAAANAPTPHCNHAIAASSTCTATP